MIDEVLVPILSYDVEGKKWRISSDEDFFDSKYFYCAIENLAFNGKAANQAREQLKSLNYAEKKIYDISLLPVREVYSLMNMVDLIIQKTNPKEMDAWNEVYRKIEMIYNSKKVKE